MTNQQIWDLACKSTLQAISDGYARFPKKITGKSIDKVIKGAYTALSKDILKFPVPEMPKELNEVVGQVIFLDGSNTPHIIR